MSVQMIAIAVSTFSLAVSGITIWLTLLRRGTLKMTQPTVVFFGPDGPDGLQKVFLRTLLYSTARRGHIVEEMFVRLRRGETTQNFSVWCYGDKLLVRGSGLRVGYEGVAYNHHFLLPHDVTGYEFADGQYTVEVFASLVNVSKPLLLSRLHLSVSKEFSNALRTRDCGIYFDWGPDSQQYHPHLDTHSDKKTTIAI